MKKTGLLLSFLLLSAQATADFRIINETQPQRTPMLLVIESYENERLKAALERTQEELDLLRATVKMDTGTDNNQITVYFGFNDTRFKPTPDVATNIVDLAKQAKWVGIRGYTDSIGSDKVNEQVATKRAEAARRYLISQGVDASKISSFGTAGEYRRSNGTEFDRAFNRRAEIEFTNAIVFEE